MVERNKGHKGTKWIKERRKEIRDEGMKKIIGF
jgi:hypothetical protein